MMHPGWLVPLGGHAKAGSGVTGDEPIRAGSARFEPVGGQFRRVRPASGRFGLVRTSAGRFGPAMSQDFRLMTASELVRARHQLQFQTYRPSGYSYVKQ